MTVKAIRKITKTSDQDWSGVYIKKIETSVGSTPDPRDQVTNYSNSEIRIIRDEVKYNIRNAEGYEGWDREYVGENELRLIYYFSNRSSANTFIHAFPSPHKGVKKEFIGILKDKTTSYTGSWFIVDENNQEEEIIITNA
jgi:hypothetical protein